MRDNSKKVIVIDTSIANELDMTKLLKDKRKNGYILIFPSTIIEELARHNEKTKEKETLFEHQVSSMLHMALESGSIIYPIGLNNHLHGWHDENLNDKVDTSVILTARNFGKLGYDVTVFTSDLKLAAKASGDNIKFKCFALTGNHFVNQKEKEKTEADTIARQPEEKQEELTAKIEISKDNPSISLNIKRHTSKSVYFDTRQNAQILYYLKYLGEYREMNNRMFVLKEYDVLYELCDNELKMLWITNPSPQNVFDENKEGKEKESKGDEEGNAIYMGKVVFNRRPEKEDILEYIEKLQYAI